MVNVLLFCIAEEAKPLVPELLNAYQKGSSTTPMFLAESRQGPADGGQEFRTRLGEGDEPVADDFLGASVEECGAFQQEQQARTEMMEWNSLVLLDARSARDGTAVYGHYVGRGDAYMLRREDQRGDAWYTFRVPYAKVSEMVAAMPPYGDADETWGCTTTVRRSSRTSAGFSTWTGRGSCAGRTRGSCTWRSSGGGFANIRIPHDMAAQIVR
ncbi:hypothetical protein PG984_013419 [Apiospora sp. TS-2023a]